MAFSIRQTLARRFPVQPGEGRRVFVAAVANFLVVGGVFLGRSARDSLFLKNIGIQFLPYMYAASAVVVVSSAMVYSSLVDRLERRRFFTVSFLLFSGVLVASRLALALQVRWFYAALYVLAQTIWILSVMMIWTFAGDIFDTRQAKRLFPVVGLGGLLSMILCGFVTRPLVKLMGSANLFLVWGALLAAALVLLRAGMASFQQAPAGSAPGRPSQPNWKENLKEGFGHVTSTPLLRAMAGITLTLWVVYVLVDYQFNQVMVRTYPTQDQLTSFLGTFAGLAGFGSLLFQLVLTPWLIANLGVGYTIVMHPLTLVLANAGMLLHFGYGTSFFAKYGDHVMMYTVQDSSFQLLFNPVPLDHRGRVRAFLEGYFKPVTMALAGLFLAVGNYFHLLNTQLITSFTLMVAMLWFFFAMKVRRAYVEALVANLGGESVAQRLLAADALAKLKDPDTLARLAEAIRTAEPSSALLAMQFLERFGQPETHGLLLSLLDHETPIIRATAVAALGRLKRPELIEHLKDLLQDPEARVRANAGEACLTLEPRGMREALQNCLKDPSDRVRGSAIAALVKLQEVPPSDLLPLVEEMCHSPIEDRRAAGAYALSCFPVVIARPLLVELLHDTKARTRLRAIRSLATVGDTECVPAILEMMSGISTTRREGRQALLAIATRQPDETFARVVDSLDSQKTAVCMSAIFALGRLGRAEGLPHLARVLTEPDPSRHEAALNSIEKLALRHTLLPDVRQALEKCAANELGHMEGNLARLRTVENLNGGAVQSKGDFGPAGAVQSKGDFGPAGPQAQSSVVEAGSWLGQALTAENRHIRDRIFRAAGLLYDARRVREVAVGVADADVRKRATALEALEYVVPGGLGKKLASLLEAESRPRAASELRLADVLLQLAAHRNPAVRACTMLLAGAAQIRECAAAVEEHLLDPAPMVREVAVEASWQLLGPQALPHLERLEQDADPRVCRAAHHVLRQAAGTQAQPESQAAPAASPIPLSEAPMLLTVEKVLFLKSVPLFAFLEGEELASVAEISEELEVEPGAVIFQQGDSGDELYVIVSGRVKVYGERAGGEVVLAQLAERECFGEMALLDSEPRSASVAAMESCRLLKIRGEDFHELLHEQPQISLEILKILVRRLRRMDVELESQPVFSSAQQYM